MSVSVAISATRQWRTQIDDALRRRHAAPAAVRDYSTIGGLCYLAPLLG
ncbi:hypothetical protein [Kallotenue papyrolyticum]|nr:hypothetical protein [Kallotenue papyrolyticum]